MTATAGFLTFLLVTVVLLFAVLFRPVFVRQNTPGGNTLGAPQQSGQANASNPTSLNLITLTDWDVVVLQEQSTLPTIPSSFSAWRGRPICCI